MEAISKKVEAYMAKGCDRRTAEYYAGGRKRIVSVAANEDFTLTLVFDNQEKRILDCKPILMEGTVFARFADIENFRRVYLDDNNCVAWDIDPAVDSKVDWMNKVDLCPDSCYMDSVPA